MYYPDESVFDDYYNNGDGPHISEKTGFYRHLLHAAKITYKHPVSGKKISIECPMPEDMSLKWKEISSHC